MKQKTIEQLEAELAAARTNTPEKRLEAELERAKQRAAAEAKVAKPLAEIRARAKPNLPELVHDLAGEVFAVMLILFEKLPNFVEDESIKMRLARHEGETLLSSNGVDPFGTNPHGHDHAIPMGTSADIVAAVHARLQELCADEGVSDNQLWPALQLALQGARAFRFAKPATTNETTAPAA